QFAQKRRRALITSLDVQKSSEKTEFSTRGFSGSAFGRSSLILVTFVSWRSVPLPVGSSCQSRLCSSARRIPKKRTVLASAPCGSASLRRLTAPPSAYPIANYETNVFYWPVEAQFQPLEAHPKCRSPRECRTLPRLLPQILESSKAVSSRC